MFTIFSESSYFCHRLLNLFHLQHEHYTGSQGDSRRLCFLYGVAPEAAAAEAALFSRLLVMFQMLAMLTPGVDEQSRGCQSNKGQKQRIFDQVLSLLVS